MIEIKRFKTSHFKESKTALLDREKLGAKEHVACPQSEPANNDIQLGAAWLVAARIAKELGINRETVGRYLRPPKPAISIAGAGAGRRSRCESFAEPIAAKVEVGLSAQRIYQDLVEEKGFSDSYQSVQRFVRKLKVAQPQRVWRMEARPGEEVPVDFGLGAPIWEESGRPRRSWVFRMVLSYSRKVYSHCTTCSLKTWP